MTTTKQNYNYQKIIAVVGILLFALKVIAWYITDSVSILTDALESTVNIFTAFIGLYSLYLSAKPKDANHPYGHGKAEFVSAAIEGTLVSVAGLIIIYETFHNLRHHHKLGRLDNGIYLVAISAVINYVVGAIAIRKGKSGNSLALVASGKHLQTDTYSTIGIIIGLVLIILTGYVWLDSVVALVFACIIMITGYKIIRTSLAGIMDEADVELLKKTVALLEQNRVENWIDMHNLRIIKYGPTLHLDCHVTVPWYFNVREAHVEIQKIEKLIRDNFGDSVELFVHIDPCLDFSCRICTKANCDVRQHPFEKKVEWNIKNVSSNQKHYVNS